MLVQHSVLILRVGNPSFFELPLLKASGKPALIYHEIGRHFLPKPHQKIFPFVWGSTEVTTMSLGDFVLWLLGFPSLYTAQIRGMTLSSSFHSASNQVVINPIRLAESVIDFSIPGTSN